MRILICDDEESYISPLRSFLEDCLKQHNIPCHITVTTDSQAIFASRQQFDLAFLDIQMPQVNGLTLAQELRRRNENTILFFITNFPEYQDSAMDLRALRYFKKPFEPERLKAGIEKAIENINDTYLSLYLNCGGAQQRVLFDDILYLTLEGRKVVIQTTKARFSFTGKLEDWVPRFPQSFFRQVHRSFLVNLHHVDVYTRPELTMSDGTRIPVAPKKQAELRKAWFEYLGRQ